LTICRRWSCNLRRRTTSSSSRRSMRSKAASTMRCEQPVLPPSERGRLHRKNAEDAGLSKGAVARGESLRRVGSVEGVAAGRRVASRECPEGAAIRGGGTVNRGRRKKLKNGSARPKHRMLRQRISRQRGCRCRSSEWHPHPRTTAASIAAKGPRGVTGEYSWADYFCFRGDFPAAVSRMSFRSSGVMPWVSTNWATSSRAEPLVKIRASPCVSVCRR